MMKKISLLVGVIIVINCSAFPASAVDGFGQYTTGGVGGTVATVSTAADLKRYVEPNDSPYIIQVSGTIDLNSVTSGKVSIRSNKTIRGIGESPTVIGSLAFKKGSSNVIIERLNITTPTGSYGEGDGISVKEDINNVFITKCTFYDCWDGCLDITRRSDWVTVSWCKFYFSSMNDNKDRVTLVGAGDSHTDDSGKLHITFHHNWYGPFCWQRIPSVRFGRAHVYNNYYNCSGDLYCVRTRLYAECLVENNYFKDVQNPWERYVSSVGVDHPGLLYVAGNVLDNVTWNVHGSGVVLIDGNDTVFEPNYSYTLDDANDVPGLVQYGAGANGNEGTPPHWFFTMYGDFDRSGFVDMNDFAQFAQYWPVSDCNQLSNADYNGDCKVNFYELALFAENWLYIPPDTTPPAVPSSFWAAGGDGTVSLDWNNNSESDLAGYNIYRSTTFGGGYSKLNTSLLSDSNYIDNTVTNDTIYYYVVKAVDTSSNESGYSSQVSAIPLSAGSIIVQENDTGFCGVDGPVESEWSGYTGAGYANTDNALGNGIDWTISVPSDGNYIFVWRYALVSGDRPGKLIVNGDTVVPSISFPASGALTTWVTTSSTDVSLTAGLKNIRLEAIDINGLGNIDYMKVTGTNPQAAGCP